MSSSVASIFSTTNISYHHKFNDDVKISELLSSSSTKTPILTSSLNVCYRNALLLLHTNIQEVDEQSSSPSRIQLSPYNVNEDDFDASVFPNRSLTPSSTTITQWRHDAFLNEKFLPLLIRLVAQDMYSIVFRWIELELKHEEERESKNDRKREDLRKQIYALKAMENSIDLNKLYEFSENSRDILIDQVDWKLITTQMRSKGGFKYFDEYSLKRLWIHRCQYGLKNLWSDNEDQLLNQLVEQFGHGKWIEIAQHETFQKNKKSAFMCAQRYMLKTNKLHSKRRFTQCEKDQLLSMYKHRCTIVKDYRFSVSYGAYLLGDRCIREITHVWTYLNPDIQKGSFKPEEDLILLERTNQTSSISWAILAASYLPDRSGVQCRQRYYQLIKSRSTEPKKAKKRKTCSCLKNS